MDEEIKIEKKEENKKEIKKEPIPEKEKPISKEPKVEFGATGGKKNILLEDEGSDDEEKDELKRLEIINLRKGDKIVIATTEEINELNAKSDENVTNAIVKRKRGRPRKNFNI